MNWNSSFPTNLRVGYLNFPPFVTVKNFNGTTVINGIYHQLMLALADWINLNLTFVREPNDKFGDSETWDGILGMLYRNEIDLIMNPIRPSVEVLEYAHFTTAVGFGGMTFVSGRKTQELGVFFLFKVLDTTVWMAILTAFVAIVTISIIIHRKVTVPGPYSVIYVTHQYCWLFLSYTLRQNPNDCFPRRKSKRSVAVFLPVFDVLWKMCIAFIVMQTIQSLMVSKITVKKSQPLVDSLTDVLKLDAPLTIVPLEIPIEVYLKIPDMPVYEAVYKKLKHSIRPGKQILTHETMEEVQNGKLCIFHGHFVLKNKLKEFFERTSFCKLHLSENYIGLFPLVIPVQRNMPNGFFQKFNLGVTSLIDTDITGRTLKKVTEISTLCTNYKERKLEPLSVDNIYGVLLIWLAGLLSGGLILACEILCKNVKTRQCENSVDESIKKSVKFGRER